MNKILALFAPRTNEAHKAQVVKNIEKANGRGYKSQLAGQAIANEVLNDMLSDPFWADVIADYVSAQ